MKRLAKTNLNPTSSRLIRRATERSSNRRSLRMNFDRAVFRFHDDKNPSLVRQSPARTNGCAWARRGCWRRRVSNWVMHAKKLVPPCPSKSTQRRKVGRVAATEIKARTRAVSNFSHRQTAEGRTLLSDVAKVLPRASQRIARRLWRYLAETRHRQTHGSHRSIFKNR